MVNPSGAAMTANGLWAQIVVPATTSATLISQTYPDNTQVIAGRSFTKSWTVRNSGTITWNSGYSLQYVSASSAAFCNHSNAAVSGTVAPGANYMFSITCTAPAAGGTYQETWRMIGPSAVVNVSGSPTLAVKIVSVANSLPESTHPYGNQFDQTWTYTFPGSVQYGVDVTFSTETVVENGYDFIYVMNSSGQNIAGSPFTGTQLSNRTVRVPGNTVKIRLRTDGSVTAYGFRVTRVASGSLIKQTIFLVHGLSQRGGALSGLKTNLLSSSSRIDTTRFEVDDGFDWPCAENSVLNDCQDHVTEGGRMLAKYIAQRTSEKATTPIILIGYSLGGLVTRDLMLNNYDSVLSQRTVAAYITLGTPHLGYPYLPIDMSLKADGPIKDMAGDFRNSAASISFGPLYDDPYTHDLLDGDQQRVATSQYLYNLNTKWSTMSFVGKPRYWMAAGGRSCSDAVRGVSTLGCPTSNGFSDGVVCDQSARHVFDAPNAPNDRWEDVSRAYGHISSSTSWVVLCSTSNAIPLFNPTASGTLFTKIKEVINALP
jgi:pimeloyl-ACP methyl ester carboxylesterase